MDNQPERKIECDCMDQCSMDIRVKLLTGHHENCPKNSVWNASQRGLDIIKALVDGMDAWASDEDGIHPEAYEAYKKARAVLAWPVQEVL